MSILDTFIFVPREPVAETAAIAMSIIGTFIFVPREPVAETAATWTVDTWLHEPTVVRKTTYAYSYG
jgi:hypothetical protein